jgi:hypothetical protein
MPRNAGIGRTGKKHKKKALFDTHRQPKLEAGVAESPAVAEAASSSKNDELEEAAAVMLMAQATITSESESEEGAEEGSGPAGTSVQAQRPAEGPPCGEEGASEETEPEPEPDPCMSPSPTLRGYKGL